MINVYTWWEFLDAFLNRPDEIKPWVVFDEAHTDLPSYQKLIEGFRKVGRKQRGFGMVEMSATFGDLPTSKKLTGTITDYYVTDFKKVVAKNSEAFKKTTIVFCDDVSKINLKPLKDKKIKYLILNDSLKDYATDIVRSLEPPMLVFANRDYSVGFSFGDVNVISTGVSQRTIITDEMGTKKVIPGTSDFADLLQERGRGVRDKEHSAIWMSLIPKNGDYKGKLKGDYAGERIEVYFKNPKDESLKKDLGKIIKLFSKPEPIPELSKEDGSLNLNRVLVRNLKEKLDPAKLFTIKPSEKGKREAGEYVFENKLMKYFDESQITDILIEATREKIKTYVKDYDWYHTAEEEDDYVFTSEADAKAVGFLLQAREEGNGYEMEVIKNKLYNNRKV